MGRWRRIEPAVKKEPFDKELEKKFRHAKIRAAEQHFTQGREWLKKGQIPEALQEFEIALGLDPDKPEHHTALNDAWRLRSARSKRSLTPSKWKGLGAFG